MTTAIFTRRSLCALPVLLAVAGGLLMAPNTAQALTVSAGQGPQYAKIAVTYASTKACKAALGYIAMAKTDPYYHTSLSSHDYTFSNDYWLYYRYQQVTESINTSAAKVTNLCANVTAADDYSNITKDSQLSSTTTASKAGAANAKQLAQQAVTLAKAGRCEEAEVMIDNAQSALSIKGSGYVGQGTAVEVVNSLMQVRSLCIMTGQAATDASVATAAAGGADTTVAANKDEAQKRLQAAVMLAQTTLNQAKAGNCSIVETLLPTIEERVPYYLNGNVTVMSNDNVTALKAQAKSACSAVGGVSSTTGTTSSSPPSSNGLCAQGGSMHDVNTSWLGACSYKDSTSSQVKTGCMRYFCVPASSLTGTAIQEGGTCSESNCTVTY